MEERLETFASGAKKHDRKGKGRFDLLPFKAIKYFRGFMSQETAAHIEDLFDELIYNYLADIDIKKTITYIINNILDDYVGGVMTCYALIELVAKRMEDGLEFYEEHNWRKGIPHNSFIDSGIRHYYKHIYNIKPEENHLSASLWNFMCLLETIIEEEEKMEKEKFTRRIKNE